MTLTLTEAYEQNLRYTWQLARRFGVPPSEIDDVVSEAWVAVTLAWPRYNQASPVKPWLFAIVSNAAIDRHRRRALEPLLMHDPDALPSPAGPDAEQAAALQQILILALSRLPMREAYALWAAEVEGRTLAEIAVDTGETESAVEHTLRRARATLRAALARIEAHAKWEEDRPSGLPLLFSAASTVDGAPPPGAGDTVWNEVQARLSAAGPAFSSALAAPAPPPGLVGRLARASLPFLVGILAGAPAAARFAARPPLVPMPAPVAAVTTATASAAEVPWVPGEEPRPVTSPKAPAPRPSTTTGRAPPPASPLSSITQLPPDASEATILAAARARLTGHEHDPQAREETLVMLAEHARRFPRGNLATAREEMRRTIGSL